MFRANSVRLGFVAVVVAAGLVLTAVKHTDARASVAPAVTPACAFLGEELTRVKAVGFEEGAQARLMADLLRFAGDDQWNGKAFDAEVEGACPSARTEVLSVVGVSSFTQF